MNEQEPHDRGPGPSRHGQSKARPKLPVIPCDTPPLPDHLRRPPKMRVIGDEDERLTTGEWRKRFAQNLDRLLGLVGMSRKQAAEEIGVPYPLVRRLVSAGVSRTDDRGAGELTKIAAYFTLDELDDLWRADLVQTVLHPVRGRAFVEKFRRRLAAERGRRLADSRPPAVDELTLLSRALGIETPGPATLSGPEATKVAAILASPRGATFRLVIDDYYDLTRRSGDEQDGRSAARG